MERELIKMKYPKYEIYEQIYKRYFKRDVEEFIHLGEVTKNDQTLDICGGNGRLSKALLNYTKNVSYLDQEQDMIPQELTSLGITVYHTPIEVFVNENQKQYDKVFCQQAINYWLLHIDMKKFSELIKPYGLFIFNTFKNKPSTVPMIKTYEIENKHYIEISYLVNNQVYHIQICEGYPPHFTVFDWISEETYQEVLSPYFEIEKIEDQKTLIYKCRRK